MVFYSAFADMSFYRSPLINICKLALFSSALSIRSIISSASSLLPEPLYSKFISIVLLLVLLETLLSSADFPLIPNIDSGVKPLTLANRFVSACISSDRPSVKSFIASTAVPLPLSIAFATDIGKDTAVDAMKDLTDDISDEMHAETKLLVSDIGFIRE